MPNTTNPLCKGIGRTARVFLSPFPFKEILPIKLQDRVSGKGDKRQESGCTHEISVLMACLKQNGYKEKKCSKEIEAFQSCSDKITAESRERKAQDKAGIVTAGATRLRANQLNKLLKEYPQPK